MDELKSLFCFKELLFARENVVPEGIDCEHELEERERTSMSQLVLASGRTNQIEQQEQEKQQTASN